MPGRDYSCIAEVRSPFGTGTSDAIHFRTLGEAQAILTVSAGAGGSVITPNSRFIATEMNAEQRVEASAFGNCYFAGWSGSAVLAGKVDDPSSASTIVTLDSDYSLKANFLSRLDTIHVDDDALHDPGPYDVSTSDPAEDGTNEHPYDSIQEAIDVARQHSTILVRDGVYYETIHVRDRVSTFAARIPMQSTMWCFQLLTPTMQTPWPPLIWEKIQLVV